MKNKYGRMKFGRPYKPLFGFRYNMAVSRQLLALLIILALLWCVVSAVTAARPVIEDVSKKLLQAHGTQIINHAVADSLKKGNIYEEIVHITRNELGEITSISANSAAVNKLKADLSLDVLNRIEQFGSHGFSVPLGNLTDIILLSGIGPEIPFKVVPYGAVQVDFRSAFTEAGINQTRHEIYVEITADLHAISAVAQISAPVTTSVMAAQTVIVGKVPDFYAR